MLLSVISGSAKRIRSVERLIGDISTKDVDLWRIRVVNMATVTSDLCVCLCLCACDKLCVCASLCCVSLCVWAGGCSYRNAIGANSFDCHAHHHDDEKQDLIREGRRFQNG